MPVDKGFKTLAENAMVDALRQAKENMKAGKSDTHYIHPSGLRFMISHEKGKSPFVHASYNNDGISLTKGQKQMTKQVEGDLQTLLKSSVDAEKPKEDKSVRDKVLLHKAVKQPDEKPRADSPPRITGKPKKFRAKMAEEVDPDMFEED